MLLFVNCDSSGDQTAKDEAATATVVHASTVSLDVKGMTCTGCEATIESKVKDISGVTLVEADHVQGKARIEFDADKITVDQLVAAVEAAGYDASVAESATAEK